MGCGPGVSVCNQSDQGAFALFSATHFRCVICVFVD